MSARHSRRPQRGAALLLAMLTVALVATISAAAYWQQWRSLQFELTARQRSQSALLLDGALAWARLILREDVRASSVDHLAEPWAVPLQETRLSSFLAASQSQADDITLEALLSGQISDEQGKLNLRNLVETVNEKTQLAAAEHLSFDKLFKALGLPGSELQRLEQGLLAAYAPASGSSTDAPLRPQRYEQLAWLGVSRQTLLKLAPHATWLPEATALNLNTASALALYASLPSLELAQAQAVAAARSRSHFNAITELRDLAPETGGQLSPARHSVTSRYFRVRGLLRLEGATLEANALVVRDGIRVGLLWRYHGGLQRQIQALQ
jgi:general secretion pathway protein K